jgi:flagellar basal-body rod modification protein FlgD
MTVSNVTAATTTPAASTAQSDSEDARTTLSSDFETFLNMLTAQLENQDPLDPVKSEDFAVQLATFSGVEQQVLTNDLLESLLAQDGLSGIGQYASWVGMEARAPVAAYFDGSPITVAPKPDKTAESAVLVVEDAFGNQVDRVSIPVSETPVEWSGLTNNGSLPAGLYSFKVENYSNGLVSNTSTAEVYTRVNEARLDDGSTVLVTSGGVQVDATQVTGLREGS